VYILKEKLWWKKPLRVIQTNLQVKDTPLMDGKKIANEISDMAANVLVVNVGGIYAWYQSKVKYHHINEYLPKDHDILLEIINSCHSKNIKVIARFDFSKTDDFVFQQKPQWFVRDYENKPKIYGRDRFGDWSLLLSTCINAGYRNDEVAIPVINEVLDKYDIDGVFFNAPHYEFCVCDICKQKYIDTYGKEMPAYDHNIQLDYAGAPDTFEEDWASICLKDNMEKLYKTVKSKKPDIPVVLYYNLYKDNLNARTSTADMICSEPQDVLSQGYKNITQFCKPALCIKMGRTVENYPTPFGIIHSCPGMEWRHTGLPTAEYMFWMSQIPSNGGFIWHSITGFSDTISDKRILKSISGINHMIVKVENHMDGATSLAQTLLLWNTQPSAEGWAEGLVNTQIQFDVLDSYQITLGKIKHYKTVIIPEKYQFTDKLIKIIRDYVADGGTIILEEASGSINKDLLEIIGIQTGIVSSEYLAASYFRFGKDCGSLQKGLEDTPLIPHRGEVAYCSPEADAQVLATLVPPFAPIDAVGAPPERASILTPKTDLPLCTLHRYGKGTALFLPFKLSMLAQDYKLSEHYQLMRNCVDLLLGKSKKFNMNIVNGLQAMMYEKENKILIHFVNGIGQRPLATTIPFHNLNFTVKLEENEKIKSVISCIAEEEVSYRYENNMLYCTLPLLEVWDMIKIEIE